MRYKSIVTTKLENLNNSLNNLRHRVLFQGSSVQEIHQTFDQIKEKLEEIQTLINSENEQSQGSW